ncbi:MAG TPA: hypothetical protein VFV37_04635 [Luteibaculaceae bacterium]|nr:hypothetical protein [Luteibaculaceae bacterium]
MDYEFEMRWQSLVKELERDFGMPADVQAILYLIGVQELGKGFKKFKKDDKVNLMHIAICRILEPYGYYQYEGIDAEGWPHYTAIKKLPPLESDQQQQLMKSAILDYFTE